MKKKTITLFWATAFCALCLFAKYLTEKPLTTAKNLREKIELRPGDASYQGKSLKRYSFGFDQAISDLIWIQLLQRANHEKLKEGTVSWEFAQLDAITLLDPKFNRAYSFGAVFLSVFRQDKLGAKLLLQKWADRNPRLWTAQYYLGHHLYFEMGDATAAYPYLIKAASLPHAPAWITSLGIRLMSETGALAQALQMSVELYPEISIPEARYRVSLRIRSLNYHLQKAAWEKAVQNYREKTGQEPTSLADVASAMKENLRELASIVSIPEAAPELAGFVSERFRFTWDPKTKQVRAADSRLDSELENVGVYRPASRKETRHD